jgi:quinol-cytochrome oxidoreductase complex cytochrome b subunit
MCAERKRGAWCSPFSAMFALQSVVVVIVVMMTIAGGACVLHTHVVAVHEAGAVFIAGVTIYGRMTVQGRAARIHIRPVCEIVACRFYAVLKAAAINI